MFIRTTPLRALFRMEGLRKCNGGRQIPEKVLEGDTAMPEELENGIKLRAEVNQEKEVFEGIKKKRRGRG